MALSTKQLSKKIRNNYFIELVNWLESIGEDALIISNNEVCISCYDEENNERFLQFTVSVPTACRGGYAAFDPYSLAEDFQIEQEAELLNKTNKK